MRLAAWKGRSFDNETIGAFLDAFDRGVKSGD
jgi:hypothetical protein